MKHRQADLGIHSPNAQLIPSTRPKCDPLRSSCREYECAKDWSALQPPSDQTVDEGTEDRDIPIHDRPPPATGLPSSRVPSNGRTIEYFAGTVFVAGSPSSARLGLGSALGTF